MRTFDASEYEQMRGVKPEYHAQIEWAGPSGWMYGTLSVMHKGGRRAFMWRESSFAVSGHRAFHPSDWLAATLEQPADEYIKQARSLLRRGILPEEAEAWLRLIAYPDQVAE